MCQRSILLFGCSALSTLLYGYRCLRGMSNQRGVPLCRNNDCIVSCLRNTSWRSASAPTTRKFENNHAQLARFGEPHHGVKLRPRIFGAGNANIHELTCDLPATLSGELAQFGQLHLGIKDVNADTVAEARMVEINRAIAKAREPDGEVEALQALEKIPGVGLATATALLTVCYPEVFTIIDERVLEMLDLFPSGLHAAKRTRHSTEDWTARQYWDEYVPEVKKQSEAWKGTLRDADRALWGLSVRGRVDEIIDKSEKLPVEFVAYGAMDASQRQAFQAMVEEGGEVAARGLSDRMSEAHGLAYAAQGDHFIAVGAMKRPRETYRSDVARKSEYDISDYEAELGWIYVAPEARGIGLGSRISKALCDSYEGATFATTRTDNEDMHDILKKLGFRAVGKPYESAEHAGKKIQLWVLLREANAP